jgi:hypothetical protein
VKLKKTAKNNEAHIVEKSLVNMLSISALLGLYSVDNHRVDITIRVEARGMAECC